MNAPWFDPTQIDWQDGLNPLAIPAYREQRNPAVYRALQGPTMVELRNTPGLELRLYAAPDEAFPSLPGSITYDTIVTLPAGAWIYGISASSAQPEGFLAQVTAPTHGTLFSKPVNSGDIKNARPHYLSRPQGLPDGGPVKLRLINLSLVANYCQLVIWVIQPS
jgi:hypothetical protein